MEAAFRFFLQNLLLGTGLAMDAFSVSCANGLREPAMKKGRMSLIAGTYAAFQFLMPLIGWVCVRTIADRFAAFQKLVPWIALILLVLIGGNMLLEGLRRVEEEEESKPLSLSVLLTQGIATSIDALSVGFTISGYTLPSALAACSVIGTVTFVICIGGLMIGRAVGTRFSRKASILGGLILIAVGIEIFLSGIL